MTSADKVKVSTPMSYKTKQSLDSISMKTVNSQKSTRIQIPNYRDEESSRQSEVSMSATGTAGSTTMKDKKEKKGSNILTQKKQNKIGKSLGWRYLSSVIKK